MEVFNNYTAPNCVHCKIANGSSTRWCFYCYNTVCEKCVPINSFLAICCHLCKQPSIHFCSNECRRVPRSDRGLTLCATDQCKCNCFFQVLGKIFWHKNSKIHCRRADPNNRHWQVIIQEKNRPIGGRDTFSHSTYYETCSFKDERSTDHRHYHVYFLS